MKTIGYHDKRPAEVNRSATRLKISAMAVVLAVAVLGCGNQNDEQLGESAQKQQSDDKPNQRQEAEPRNPLAYSSLDTDYKSSVKAFAETRLFDGKSEEEILAYVRDGNMHYLYVAFIEMFPTNAYVAECRERLNRFQLLEAPGPDELHVSVSELRDKYGLKNDQDRRVYYWGKGPGFMMVGGGASKSE